MPETWPRPIVVKLPGRDCDAPAHSIVLQSILSAEPIDRFFTDAQLAGGFHNAQGAGRRPSSVDQARDFSARTSVAAADGSPVRFNQWS